MEQLTIQKMKFNEQLKIHLKDMGFEEVKPGLFLKNITTNVTLFRDYRGEAPISYAYTKNKPTDPYTFKETRAIEKIEKHLDSEPDGTLQSFT